MAKPVDIDFSSPTSNTRDEKLSNNKALKRKFVVDDDLSSSDDEYQRNHNEEPRLSENGRAIKKRLENEAALEETRSTFGESSRVSYRSKTSSQETNAALQQKETKISTPTEKSTVNAIDIYDQEFGIRVRNPKISSSIFQTYCSGLEKIRPSRLKSGTSAPSGAWVTMGVVSDKSDYRKSANGHDYMIWRVADLTDCQCAPLKVFLFGDCLTEHWKVQVGYVIALTTPAFMDGTCKDASVTLKVTKSIHLIEIGFCPDFAICKANKNDGSVCKNVVNKSLSDYCIYHIEKMARRISANRGTFDTTTSNPSRFAANNKLRNFSNFFYGGSLVGSQKSGVSRAANAPAKHLPFDRNRTSHNALVSSQLLTTTPAASQLTSSSQIPNKQEITQKEHDRLKKIIGNRTHMAGVQNLLKYYSKRDDKSTTGNHLAISFAAEKEQRAQSLKDFINSETKREALNKHVAPVLGRGQQNGIISLCSPQKRASSRQVAAERAKQRAVAVIHSKGGIDKLHPKESNDGSESKRKQPESCGTISNNDAKTADNSSSGSLIANKTFTKDDLLALLNKKTTHEPELIQDELDRENLYFTTMQQKEKVETFVTETMEVKNCDVVTCNKCKYTWHRQSDYCLSQGHKVVKHKANKRYFRCRSCSKRTISYNLLPIKACSQCGENNYERVGMRDERKVKPLTTKLLIRGEECKFFK